MNKKLFYDIKSDQTPCVSEVGMKGYHLIKMKDYEIDIPKGFIITASFFDTWIEEIKSTKLWEDFVQNPDKEKSEILKRRILNMNFSKEQKQLLDERMKAYDFEFVAIRSSYYSEEKVNFEGMFEFYLNCSMDDIYQKIKHVIASLFDEAMTKYKQMYCIPLASLSMAIIIQEQISSDVCGTCFSRNPNNNNYDEIYITSNQGVRKIKDLKGLSNDKMIINKFSQSVIAMEIGKKEFKYMMAMSSGTEKVANEHSDKLSLSQSEYIAVMNLIETCQRVSDEIIKIEWCIANGQIYLLEILPDMNAIPLPKHMITEHDQKRKLYFDYLVATQGYSQSLSVLGIDFCAPYLNMLEYQILPEGDEGYLILDTGRLYINVSNMLKGFGKKITITTLSEYNQTAEKILKALPLKDEFKSLEKTKLMSKSRSNLYEMTKKQLHSIGRSEKDILEYGQNCMANNLKVFDQINNDILPYYHANKSLRITYKYILDSMASALDNKQATVAGLHAMRKLEKIFSDSDEKETLNILLAHLDSNPVTDMNHQLKRMSAMQCFLDCQSYEAFCALIDYKNQNKVFVSELEKYLNKYGSRCFGEIDIAHERGKENLQLVYNQMKALELYDLKLFDQKGTEAYNTLLALAQSKNKEKEFLENVKIYNQLIGYREWPKYLFTVMIGCFRSIALDAGKTFYKDGRIDKIDDIFNLHMDEIDNAILNDYIDLRECIEKNLSKYRKTAYVNSWPMCIDSRGQIYKHTLEEKDGRFIGRAVSSGFKQGPVKVLNAPFDKRIIEGDIVVAKAVEPVWMPVLCKASGLILEVGSHEEYEKIIAREYDIPCIVNIDNVSNRLKDGDYIQVNGDMGYIKIIEKNH